MESDLGQRIALLEQKVDAMYVSVEKVRKYFLWTGIITVVLFVLPLIGLFFAIPTFLNSYVQLDTMDQTGGTNPLNSLDSLLQ